MLEFGHPSKLSSEQKSLVLDLIAQGRSVKNIAKMFKVDRSTIYPM